MGPSGMAASADDGHQMRATQALPLSGMAGVVRQFVVQNVSRENMNVIFPEFLILVDLIGDATLEGSHLRIPKPDIFMKNKF